MTVAEQLYISDVTLRDTLAATPWLHYVGAALGAAFVVLAGRFLQKRAHVAAH